MFGLKVNPKKYLWVCSIYAKPSTVDEGLVVKESSIYHRLTTDSFEPTLNMRLIWDHGCQSEVKPYKNGHFQAIGWFVVFSLS